MSRLFTRLASCLMTIQQELKIQFGTGYFTAWIFACLTLSACKQECEGDCIEIYGRVGSEHGSVAPVSGATVRLTGLRGSGGPSFPVPNIEIGQVRTNSSGAYSLKFARPSEMQNSTRYRLTYYKKGYGDETQGPSITPAYATGLSLTPGVSHRRNLHLPLLGGRLRIQVTGLPANLSVNHIGIRVAPGRVGQGYYSRNMAPSFYDVIKDASGSNIIEATCQTAGNEYALISISKLQAGTEIRIQDSIYCPANTMVTYTHAF